MKKIILIAFCLIIYVSALKAQQHFNHLTVYVVDLKKSSAFYRDVMQLQEITEPFHDNHHTWFKIGEHNELHVVSGAKEKIPHDINIHFAFSVPSVESFAEHLDSFHIKYGNWNQTSKDPQVRPDGIKQIYLQDPDGYWIEVNDDKF
ncbi:VOC family protein [Parafilimonas sp.]|uniref:VOC family protein n=1 Tax=Parafilimonas sp. TaxID=1969739 RepID=UPI0039E2E194